MQLYITDFSLSVLTVLYLPVVVWTVWHIAHSAKLRGARKTAVLIAVALLACALPLGDVTLNSIAMAKVCPKAGLHIYKEVEVDGYFDRSASEHDLQRYPYRFIEYTRPGQKVTRLERQADGEIVRMTLDSPSAEHEVVYDNPKFDKDLRVTRERWWVRDRTTGEAIGEWLMFSPQIGWVDRHLVFRWFGGRLGACTGSRTPYGTWRYELLPPKTTSRPDYNNGRAR